LWRAFPGEPENLEPFSEASGTLQSEAGDIKGLSGRGVWIDHDGIYLGEAMLNGAKTPFSFEGDTKGLHVGDRIIFEYRPSPPGHAFPFEARNIRPDDGRLLNPQMNPPATAPNIIVPQGQ
jgi:hypothetical protein